jgi:hypothetical protein
MGSIFSSTENNKNKELEKHLFREASLTALFHVLTSFLVLHLAVAYMRAGTLPVCLITLLPKSLAHCLVMWNMAGVSSSPSPPFCHVIPKRVFNYFNAFYL